MNQAELQRRLVAAARAHPPDDRVPYAFEKRIMARLKELAPGDPSIVWARALWRAAAPCVALTLLLGAWSWFSPGGSQNSDWSEALESTVLAVADQEPLGESVW